MPVTPENIAVALGVTAPDPGSPQHEQWAMWIADAQMLIATRAEQLDVTPDAAKVDYVVREAVVAQVRRPDDATQVSVSVDDGSVSRTYRSGTGRVGILDDWWALLGLAGSRGRAFELDTTPEGYGRHLVDYVWVTTTDTAAPPW